MSFSFSSLLRLLVLLAVGSTILAVGLARLDPPRPTKRSLQSVKVTNINEFFLGNLPERTPYWLNADTGLMAGYALEDGDLLEMASCSPWVDEKGQRQIAGRWATRTLAGPMSMSQDFGIARYSFPGGQMLDHVSTETPPVGPPCWFPGTRARILFSAGDGRLFHYAFEPEPWEKTANPKAARDPKPRPLVWRCPKPGHGDVFFSDPIWPEDPRLSGCLIVSLREQVDNHERVRSYSRSQLYWVKLNFAGTEIVDIGRILTSDDAQLDNQDYDHRSPAVGTLPDGRLALSYLRQKFKDVGWELHVVPLEIDRTNHVPRAFEPGSVRLATKCQPGLPTFSTDGHYLNAIASPDYLESRVARFSLDGIFPQPH